MTRQKMYGLVVLVLVITFDGAFPARLIGKWSAIAKASSEQNRQLQLELVGEAKMQRNTPIRLIGSLTSDRYWTSVLPLTEEQKKVILALNHLVNEGRYQTRLADADAAAVTADPTRREQLLPSDLCQRNPRMRRGLRYRAPRWRESTFWISRRSFTPWPLTQVSSVSRPIRRRF